jgi:hypothetical protein
VNRARNGLLIKVGIFLSYVKHVPSEKGKRGIINE